MPTKLPLEVIVERAIRNSLTDLKGLEPADRVAVLKLATDFLKIKQLIKREGMGSAFSALDIQDNNDSNTDPETAVAE